MALKDGRQIRRARLGRKFHLENVRCPGCGEGFPMHPKLGWNVVAVLIVVEEVSFMRGDDVVSYWHPRCFTVPGLIA